MVTMILHMSWNRITALGENRSHVYSPRNTTCMEYLKSQITFVSSADCYCQYFLLLENNVRYGIKVYICKFVHLYVYPFWL